jgi:hypothetical protein
MAFIQSFRRGNRASVRLQPTQVECHYSVGKSGGKTLLQLDTFGSKDRENPGKQSQTLQLDEERARVLIQLLRSEFKIDS